MYNYFSDQEVDVSMTAQEIIMYTHVNDIMETYH